MNYTTLISLTIWMTLTSSACNAFSPHRAAVVTPGVDISPSPFYHRRLHSQRTAVFSQKNNGHTHEDYYNAEEAAAFDAHDLSDPGMEAAVMERAVMMAHDLVAKNKNCESKPKNKAKASEEDLAQEYATEEPFLIMLEKVKKDAGDDDIFEACAMYKQDPTKFKEEYTKMDPQQGVVAIQVLEKLIADKIKQIAGMELQLQSITQAFFRDIHREEMAEARTAVALKEAQAAEERLHDTEGFDGIHERDERKRDLAVSHVAHEEQNFERRVESDAVREEKEDLLREYEMNRALERERRQEDVLRADLKEIKEMMKEQFLVEWKKE